MPCRGGDAATRPEPPVTARTSAAASRRFPDLGCYQPVSFATERCHPHPHSRLVPSVVGRFAEFSLTTRLANCDGGCSPGTTRRCWARAPPTRRCGGRCRHCFPGLNWGNTGASGSGRARGSAWTRRRCVRTRERCRLPHEPCPPRSAARPRAAPPRLPPPPQGSTSRWPAYLPRPPTVTAESHLPRQPVQVPRAMQKVDSPPVAGGRAGFGGGGVDHLEDWPVAVVLRRPVRRPYLVVEDLQRAVDGEPGIAEFPSELRVAHARTVAGAISSAYGKRRNKQIATLSSQEAPGTLSDHAYGGL